MIPSKLEKCSSSINHSNQLYVHVFYVYEKRQKSQTTEMMKNDDFVDKQFELQKEIDKLNKDEVS